MSRLRERYDQLPPSMRDRPGFTRWRPLPEAERFWAIGCAPNARLAHRVKGLWPGNDAVQCVCNASICLHEDRYGWEDEGGRRVEFERIPDHIRLCKRCVLLDNTVE